MKKPTGTSRGFYIKSRRWESNPRIQLGRLVFYHWTTPAKCPEPESNQWHEDFQSSALPTELSGHLKLCLLTLLRVAGIGFEPMTFGLWARRASRLLHPALFNSLYASLRDFILKEMDGGGFEPPKQFAADLQSVPFGHSGTHPYGIFHQADNRTRTDNLLITNQLLCQLSHIGKCYYRTSKGNGAYRARTYDPLLVRQMLSQLS